MERGRSFRITRNGGMGRNGQGEPNDGKRKEKIVGWKVERKVV